MTETDEILDPIEDENNEDNQEQEDTTDYKTLYEQTKAEKEKYE
jgi:hypothetical protein